MVTTKKVVAAIVLIILEAVAFVLALVAYVKAVNTVKNCSDNKTAFVLFSMGGFICSAICFSFMAIGYIYLLICCDRDKFATTPYWLFLRPIICYIPATVLFAFVRFAVKDPSGDVLNKSPCSVSNSHTFQLIAMCWSAVIVLVSSALFVVFLLEKEDSKDDIKYQRV